MNKQYWLDMAEVLDALRTIPRISLAIAWSTSLYVGLWYMELSDPTSEQSAFALTVAGALAKAQDYYNKGGRQWGQS